MFSFQVLSWPTQGYFSHATEAHGCSLSQMTHTEGAVPGAAQGIAENQKSPELPKILSSPWAMGVGSSESLGAWRWLSQSLLLLLLLLHWESSEVSELATGATLLGHKQEQVTAQDCPLLTAASWKARSFILHFLRLCPGGDCWPCSDSLLRHFQCHLWLLQRGLSPVPCALHSLYSHFQLFCLCNFCSSAAELCKCHLGSFVCLFFLFSFHIFLLGNWSLSNSIKTWSLPWTFVSAAGMFPPSNVAVVSAFGLVYTAVSSQC